MYNKDGTKDKLKEVSKHEHPNQIRVKDPIFHIKQGTVKVHEKSQANARDYWRTVVLNELSIKQMILRELHCVLYAGHPGFIRTLHIVKQFFYWTHMTADVREFVLDCPVCQIEKDSHVKSGGQLQPLELPMRKWDHVVLDFVVGMPKQEGFDKILIVVDKATKMCHFLRCSESIFAKEVATLYWCRVGKLHGIPNIIILDRGPHFTRKF